MGGLTVGQECGAREHLFAALANAHKPHTKRFHVTLSILDSSSREETAAPAGSGIHKSPAASRDLQWRLPHQFIDDCESNQLLAHGQGRAHTSTFSSKRSSIREQGRAPTPMSAQPSSSSPLSLLWQPGDYTTGLRFPFLPWGSAFAGTRLEQAARKRGMRGTDGDRGVVP